MMVSLDLNKEIWITIIKNNRIWVHIDRDRLS